MAQDRPRSCDGGAGEESVDDRRAKAHAPSREDRLAAALRENLRRRKQQARARTEAESPHPSPAEDTDG